MELDVMLLGSLAFLLSMLTLIIVFIIKTQRDAQSTQARTRAILEAAEADEQQRRRNDNRPRVIAGQRRPIGAARRRLVDGGGRRPGVGGDEDDEDDPRAGGDFSDEDEELAGPLSAEDLGVDGNVGRKKLAKLQAKAEKRANREAEIADREERKQREKEKEERDRREQEKSKKADEEEKERERLKKEERERAEHEEYLKMKAAFAVEEEGFDQLEEEQSDNLMRDFVNYVKAAKVVNMDELGAHFQLRTQDAVDRIKYFVENGTLTGVIDDRGKFIYITMEELNAVAKFINQRGRVSVAELAEYSNQLIKLESETAAAVV